MRPAFIQVNTLTLSNQLGWSLEEHSVKELVIATYTEKFHFHSYVMGYNIC